MFTITVKTKDDKIILSYDDPILLSDALKDAGLILLKPCGGKGLCGKCTVIANGEQVRSCITYVSDNTYIDYSITEKNMQVITDGITDIFEKAPMIDNGLGMAIDIGTTTVAAYLYKFPECKLISSTGILNMQSEFGADVISRIEYSNNGGLKTLQNKIISQIKEFTEDIDIEKFVITGNTTMLHLLAGLDPKGIAVAPFEPVSLFGKWYGNAYLAPCISAYVGADITTAIIASGILNDRIALLVDIGTNGEMVLKYKDRLICCSTAAGPAFEGAGISCGMLAQSGAINSVFIDNGIIKYTTIDNSTAQGICGTGLIDAIACMLELGIIDETGYLEDTFNIGASKIYITAEDIRAVQLAKSAIRSGIDTLLHECDISVSELDCFYIAGGFGSFINKSNAAAIGLIPVMPENKIKVIGNAAGNGACMLLQNKVLAEKAQALSKSAEVTELSESPYFTEQYINNMLFYRE